MQYYLTQGGYCTLDSVLVKGASVIRAINSLKHITTTLSQQLLFNNCSYSIIMLLMVGLSHLREFLCTFAIFEWSLNRKS